MSAATAIAGQAATEGASLLPPCSVRGLSVVELTPSDRDLLAQLFERNPGYFVEVNGEPPTPDTAREELEFELPSDMTFTRKCVIGYRGEDGSLCGVSSAIADLIATGVWHIGLLLVEDSRHGTGDAQAIYRDLEEWARSSGARWLRLGVVAGNVRAERFWTRLGFVPLRERAGVVMGRRTNTVRVMMKPLRGGDVEAYLATMPRDRGE